MTKLLRSEIKLEEISSWETCEVGEHKIIARRKIWIDKFVKSIKRKISSFQLFRQALLLLVEMVWNFLLPTNWTWCFSLIFSLLFFDSILIKILSISHHNQLKALASCFGFEMNSRDSRGADREWFRVSNLRQVLSKTGFSFETVNHYRNTDFHHHVLAFTPNKLSNYRGKKRS